MLPIVFKTFIEQTLCQLPNKIERKRYYCNTDDLVVIIFFVPYLFGKIEIEQNDHGQRNGWYYKNVKAQCFHFGFAYVKSFFAFYFINTRKAVLSKNQLLMPEKGKHCKH